MNPLTPYVKALMDKACELAEAEYPKTPEHTLRQKLARIICHKKHIDPDQVAMGGNPYGSKPWPPKVESVEKGALAFVFPIQPMWMYYLLEAQEMLNTVGLLKEMDDALEPERSVIEDQEGQHSETPKTMG